MLTLDNILANVSAGERLRITDVSKVQILLDTSGLKWLAYINDTPTFKHATSFGQDYFVAITSGVLKQLERQMAENPSTFPESLKSHLEILSPRIITDFVSPEDEAKILNAAGSTYRKIKRQSELPDIGWVDANQIGYAMQNAREGKSTVLVTDDSDIIRVVKHLRRQEPYVKSHVLTASIRKYHNFLRNNLPKTVAA
jgi:hypothetical protein